MVLLIFAKYLSFYLHFFTCTYRDTHTQAHMYNQHTRGWRQPGTGLVERSGRKAFIRDKGRPCAPKKTKGRKKMWAAPHPPTEMGAKCLSAVVLDNQDLAFSQLAPVPEMEVEPTS